MGWGGGVWRWGKKEIIYISLHCHHQNDFGIKMGSGGSHFVVVVLLMVRDKVTTLSTNHNLWKRKESRSGIEPKSFCSSSLTPYS